MKLTEVDAEAFLGRQALLDLRGGLLGGLRLSFRGQLTGRGSGGSGLGGGGGVGGQLELGVVRDEQAVLRLLCLQRRFEVVDSVGHGLNVGHELLLTAGDLISINLHAPDVTDRLRCAGRRVGGHVAADSGERRDVLGLGVSDLSRLGEGLLSELELAVGLDPGGGLGLKLRGQGRLCLGVRGRGGVGICLQGCEALGSKLMALALGGELCGELLHLELGLACDLADGRGVTLQGLDLEERLVSVTSSLLEKIFYGTSHLPREDEHQKQRQH